MWRINRLRFNWFVVKTGLFGQRRRRRNGRSRNAQGKLVGAAAVAHEQKKQREVANWLGSCVLFICILHKQQELAAATEKKAGEAGNQGNGTAKVGKFLFIEW